MLGVFYFMGSFPSTLGNQYIFVVVEYVSQWIEEVVSPTNEARIVINMFKKLVSHDLGCLDW